MTDLFLVTSCIHVNFEKGWTYSKVRSAFSGTERFQDTQKTIQSIRQKMPDSKIVWLEGTKLDEDQEVYCRKAADVYLNLSECSWIQEAVDSNKKGFGEVRKLIRGLEILESMDYFLKNNIRRIFKISGRYWLSQEFDDKKYSLDKNSFRMYSNQSVSTALYSIAIQNIEEYKRILNRCNIFFEKDGCGLEILFFRYLESDIKQLSKMFVQGWIGIQKGDFYDQ
jgi:hypothetical protein